MLYWGQCRDGVLTSMLRWSAPKLTRDRGACVRVWWLPVTVDVAAKYTSARFWGDAYLFGQTFAGVVEGLAGQVPAQAGS